jgi:hypothetical protein
LSNQSCCIVGWWYDYSSIRCKVKETITKKKRLGNIFVDEVSILGEVFYKFLKEIKKIRNDIPFIISGDYLQLLPINDRISIYTDYYQSPRLLELADYNKI